MRDFGSVSRSLEMEIWVVEFERVCLDYFEPWLEADDEENSVAIHLVACCPEEM